MLIKCPECELQVSDKAIICPHCGYPLQNITQKWEPRSRSNKRRRLPNGFGQISEIKNRNLRNPFRAMVTVGKDENGRPICKTLKPQAYFATYNDAYQALVEFNKNPYDLSQTITMEELYEKWFPEYEKTVVDSYPIRYAWMYCSSVYQMRVMDIRARHIKGCIEEGTAIIKGEERHPAATTKIKIKMLFNQILDYALEYEIVERNYSRTFSLPDEISREIKTVKKEHIAFSDDEIERLWSSLDVPGVDILLIQCYSGWRPQELSLLEIKNTDLENWTFAGGVKTEAGINRTVPIHSKIRHLVRAKYQEAVEHNSPYLLNLITPGTKNIRLSYHRFYKVFLAIVKLLELNTDHRPHDGRVHFITTAKRYGVDEYAIKYLVGHSIADITEKIYTKRKFEWLRQEIEKIQ